MPSLTLQSSLMVLLYNYDLYVNSKLVYGKCVIVCFYANDLLIFAFDLDLVNDVENFLSSKFGMKDLGEAHVILGIKLHM